MEWLSRCFGRKAANGKEKKPPNPGVSNEEEVGLSSSQPSHQILSNGFGIRLSPCPPIDHVSANKNHKTSEKLEEKQKYTQEKPGVAVPPQQFPESKENEFDPKHNHSQAVNSPDSAELCSPCSKKTDMEPTKHSHSKAVNSPNLADLCSPCSKKTDMEPTKHSHSQAVNSPNSADLCSPFSKKTDMEPMENVSLDGDKDEYGEFITSSQWLPQKLEHPSVASSTGEWD